MVLTWHICVDTVVLQCHHGTAQVSSNGTVSCLCQSGWTGAHCSQSISQLCYRGTYDVVNHYCDCDPLWAGESCDIYTCMHGTVVQTGVDGDGAPMLACQCLPGWTGPEYVKCHGGLREMASVTSFDSFITV